jgi:hypothetical protein
LFFIAHGSLNKRPLKRPTSSPAPRITSATVASTDTDAGSYRSFQNTASAPTSFATANNAALVGPRRITSRAPIDLMDASSALNE